MKFAIKIAMAAGLMTLAACSGGGDDKAADNVAEAADNQADMLEEQADNTTNEVVEDRLEDRAGAVREAGEDKAEMIDDTDNSAAAGNAVNRM